MAQISKRKITRRCKPPIRQTSRNTNLQASKQTSKPSQAKPSPAKQSQAKQSQASKPAPGRASGKDMLVGTKEIAKKRGDKQSEIVRRSERDGEQERERERESRNPDSGTRRQRDKEMERPEIHTNNENQRFNPREA